MCALPNSHVLLAGGSDTEFFTFPEGGYQVNFIPSIGLGYLIEFGPPATIFHATYLGNSSISLLYHISLQSNSYVIAGMTYGPDFPCTPDAFDCDYDQWDIGDPDIVISELSSDLSTLQYSTYLPGHGSDDATGLAVDNGTAWVVGTSESFDYATTPGAMYDTLWGLQSGVITGITLPVNGVSVHDSPLPQSLVLGVYPNPFNAITMLRFRLPNTERVKVEIYDVLGRRVLQLPERIFEAGNRQIPINASALASGSYFIRLALPRDQYQVKATLIR
jgi:hypothetical protein